MENDEPKARASPPSTPTTSPRVENGVGLDHLASPNLLEEVFADSSASASPAFSRTSPHSPKRHGHKHKSASALGYGPIDSLKKLIDIALDHPSIVTIVDLSDKELKEIPSLISQLPHLKKLTLHKNAIMGIEAKTLSQSLVDLDLSSNELHTIPEQILNFPNLRKLNLCGNALDFGDLLPLCSLKHLRELWLAYTYIAELPEQISKLKHLERLELSNNEFKSFPPPILALTHLKFLNLDYNGIPEIPLALSQLTALIELRLMGNPIAEFPSEIRAAFPQTILEISIPSRIKEKLYLGDFLSAQNKKALERLKITRLVSVLPSPQDLPSTFVHNRDYHVVAEDTEDTNLLSRFTTVGEWICASIEEGHSVLVHCAAGVSRSASIVIAFLMKYEHIKFQQALANVKEIRPIINPNPGFLRQLQQYEKALALLGDTDDSEDF